MINLFVSAFQFYFSLYYSLNDQFSRYQFYILFIADLIFFRVYLIFLTSWVFIQLAKILRRVDSLPLSFNLLGRFIWRNLVSIWNISISVYFIYLQQRYNRMRILNGVLALAAFLCLPSSSFQTSDIQNLENDIYHVFSFSPVKTSLYHFVNRNRYGRYNWVSRRHRHDGIRKSRPAC
jgi:hypothetical protein